MLNILLLQSPPANPQPSGSSSFFFIQILLLFAIMYFLLIMPMQRQRKRQQRMLSELQAGQEVVTTGGIIGQIVNISDDTLVLRVRPDNIKIQVARSAVANLVQAGQAAAKK